MRLTVDELRTVLRLHAKWLRGKKGGRRANLACANLTGADLPYAELTDAELTYAELAGAYLTNANLAGANLADAELAGANLAHADLAGSKLTRANLAGAKLIGANLTDANLTDTNLAGADLTYAELAGANLAYANLAGADLTYADLAGANLDAADLTSIEHDLWAVLLPAQSEIPGLVSALKEGRIDGSCYEGECCCLVGTIAKVRGVNYDALPGIVPDAFRPAEIWFMAIKRGDTPETSPIVRITLDWIDEFLSHTLPMTEEGAK